MFPNLMPPMASLVDAFTASNLMGQAIVLLQIVISIAVWSVMLGKYRDLKFILRDVTRFRRAFSASPLILEFFLLRKKYMDPMADIYMASSESLVNQIIAEGRAYPISASDIAGITLPDSSIALVKGVSEETLAAQQLKLEGGMSLLALGSSLTPLIGLLGTVWGILDAFQAMGAKGSALLSDVAPGLSSALLTTVVGLFVAIPSAIGYNVLLGRIRVISTALDGFTDEYIARLSGEFSGSGR